MEAGWTERDAEAILALYGDDARFTDLAGGLRDAPRSAIETMVRGSLTRWPDLEDGTVSYFTDPIGGIESVEFWGLMGSTESDPLREVDEFATRDGLITSQHTMYEVGTLGHIGRGSPEAFAAMRALVQAYADAWSSDDPTSVGALYEETASRTDRMLGETNAGRQQISDAAARRFKAFPGAAWRIDQVFGDGETLGGLLIVRLAGSAACELRAAVVLERSDSAMIVAERLFWDPSSLVRCGLT